MTSSPSRLPINGMIAISGLAVIVSTVIVLNGLGTTVSSALSPGIGHADPSQELNKLTAMHQRQMETWQKQFNGRSPFFPPPPVIVNPIRQAKIETPETKPAVQPKELPHFGIFYAIGDTVRFKQSPASSKSIQINVGQEKHGVRVISTEQLPWSVKVEYDNAEYTVPIFQRGQEDKHFLDHAPEGDAE